MAKSYQELLTMIGEIEAGTTKVDFGSINIAPIQAIKSRKHRPPFQPLLDMAMDLESGHYHPSPTKQQQRQQPQSIPNQQSVQQQPSRPIDPVVLQQNQLQARIAVEEIGMFADRLDQNQQPKQVNPDNSNPDTKSIILTKLSVPDQISELEKIIEGLNQGSFTEAEKAQIKKGIHSLREQSVQEAKQKKKSARKIEQELAKLRDQQLNEAIKILGNI